MLRLSWPCFPAGTGPIAIASSTACILSDNACRCELESLASLITRMLKAYPGYMLECLNTIAQKQLKNSVAMSSVRPAQHPESLFYLLSGFENSVPSLTRL